MRYQLLFIFFLLIMSSCDNTKITENQIGDIDELEGQISVKNWSILGPFAFNKLHRRGDKATDFLADYKLFKNSYTLNEVSLYHHYIQPNDFVDLNQALDTYKPVSAFAYCDVHSSKEQNVFFLLGIDNNATIWVNDQLLLTATSKNITKNEYPVKVHLNKGKNLVVIGLSSNADAYGFHLDVASLKWVKRYKFGLNYFSITNHYLVKNGEPLSFRFSHSHLFDHHKPVSIEVSNDSGKRIINRWYKNGVNWLIPTSQLPEGVYHCRLITDKDTFNQKIIYGNYRRVFEGICREIPATLPAPESMNVNTIIRRFAYLDKFNIENGSNEVQERKMSGIAYELSQIVHQLKKKQPILKFSPGFHIRTFRSGIDHVNNNYAVYYPENYAPNTKLPLVMIMPWIAKQTPFTESWHLAFIDRIEFIEMLARKYGFVVMWQSARVYEKYNLNPIVSATALEALKYLEQDYNIDNDKIYLYGTCTGGLQALLLANRYPSLFAAVGVEGPEISYVEGEKNTGAYPALWTRNNSILNTAGNYTHIPIYIANSKNDWHGAKEPELSQLIEGIKHAHGNIILDSIANATRSFYVKMVNDNLVTDNIFNFFKHKKTTPPDTVEFSTFQLKYNHAYWISIDDVIRDGPATIKAWFANENAIHIMETNAKRFSIYLNKMPPIYKGNHIKVYLNGLLLNPVGSNNNSFTFSLKNTTSGHTRKSSSAEGPINDLFSRRFMLARSDKGSILDDSFLNNWQYNFFGSCINKRESLITIHDIESNNIMLNSTDCTNPLLLSILHKLPFKIRDNYVEIAGKKIPGSDLGFTFIYPNPLYPKNYILLTGCNTRTPWKDQLNNIALKGWSDIMIWNTKTEILLYSTNFNRDWKLDN